eukprot:Transcript_7566.p1 GENE.Transcript_7566~~Transcript_7566.p1  ORF type:complete len:857 (-),score=232.11 Transcript_7566:76-2430(-)
MKDYEGGVVAPTDNIGSPEFMCQFHGECDGVDQQAAQAAPAAAPGPSDAAAAADAAAEAAAEAYDAEVKRNADAAKAAVEAKAPVDEYNAPKGAAFGAGDEASPEAPKVPDVPQAAPTAPEAEAAPEAPVQDVDATAKQDADAAAEAAADAYDAEVKKNAEATKAAAEAKAPVDTYDAPTGAQPFGAPPKVPADAPEVPEAAPMAPEAPEATAPKALEESPAPAAVAPDVPAPAADPDAAPPFCVSIREAVTDEWCVATCVPSCPTEAQEICKCGDEAKEAQKKKAAQAHEEGGASKVPVDPSHEEGDNLTDWSGAPSAIDTVPSRPECKPVVPGYSDFWCATSCATKDGCPKDNEGKFICKCGASAQQQSNSVLGKVEDTWKEAEERARDAAIDGCTVVSCKNGLPSDAGKDGPDQEYQKAIDDWKEGENRIKAADPNEAYPYGLPPAPESQQQQQQQQQQQATSLPAPSPEAKPIKCRSIGEFKNEQRDQWCTTSCGRGAMGADCPPTMCECDGDVPDAGSRVAPQMSDATEKSLEKRDEAVAERDAKIAERDAENARIQDEIADRQANPPADWPAKAREASEQVQRERDQEIAARGGNLAPEANDFETAHGLPAATEEAQPAAAAAAVGGAVPAQPAQAQPTQAMPVPQLPDEPPALDTSGAVPQLPDAVSPSYNAPAVQAPTAQEEPAAAREEKVAKDAFWLAAHPSNFDEAAEWAKMHPKKAAEAQKKFDRAMKRDAARKRDSAKKGPAERKFDQAALELAKELSLRRQAFKPKDEHQN